MTYERYQNGVPATVGPNSREIQADLAEIRTEMGRTLEDITAKLDPKQLISQVTSAITSGGGARFLKNLWSSVERNPLPVAVIAGGVGYLIYSDIQSRKQPSSAHDALSSPHEHGEQAKSLAHDTASRAQELATKARDRGGELATRARDGARHLSHETSKLAGDAAQAARTAARKGEQMMRDQPLVLAGLGIAVGAAIAGTAPMSRREQRLMGEPAADAMDKLRDVANEKKEQLKSVAAEVVTQGPDEREAQSLEGDPSGRAELSEQSDPWQPDQTQRDDRSEQER